MKVGEVAARAGVNVETLRYYERRGLLPAPDREPSGQRRYDGRESTSRPTLLHVTNGESAGNTLRQTSLGGAVLPWQDVLHAGPVPAVSRKELLHVRAAFLSHSGWGSRSAILSSLERRDRRFVEALRDGLQVVLWFEHDLHDQLQLIDALALAAEAGAAPELIVVGSFPGKPAFRGLGELTAEELQTLWPGRRAATSSDLAAARVAWDAVRSPEPTPLSRCATGEAEALPFFADAAARLLEELPAPVDGLSGTERRALRAIAAGSTTPAAVFVAAQELEPAPFLGDAWFYLALAALGSRDVRLVETQDGRPLPPPPPLGDGSVFARISLRLTADGESVLRGDADRVRLLGVDRWVGGTHVTTESAWRWDPASRRLIP